MSATTESAAAVVVPPRLGDPYQPRPVRFIRLEPRGDWRLKVYGIATPGRTPRPELVAAAVEMALAVMPGPALDDARYGVGIVVVHDSATYCFALYYWWQSANELHQRVYAAPRDDPRALTKLADPAAGCVWELAVVDFGLGDAQYKRRFGNDSWTEYKLTLFASRPRALALAVAGLVVDGVARTAARAADTTLSTARGQAKLTDRAVGITLGDWDRFLGKNCTRRRIVENR